MPEQARAAEMLTEFKIGSSSYICDGITYQMDAVPYIKYDRVYLPVRYLAYAIGIKDSNVHWEPTLNSITLLKNSKAVSIELKSPIMWNSDVRIDMGAPSEFVNNRVFIPASIIAVAFGSKVEWNEKEKLVSIYTNKSLASSEPLKNSAEQNEPLKYYWNYGGYEWAYTGFPFMTSIELKRTYRSKPHPHNEALDYLNTYCLDKDDDTYITDLVSAFNKSASDNGFQGIQVIGLVATFVQSLPYIPDTLSGFDEYPRYPLETIDYPGGDCEDKAILAATLLKEMGYDVALIFFPDKFHCGLGVKYDECEEGICFEFNQIRYYYVETTTEGWGLGELPESLAKFNSVSVLPLP